MNGAVKARPDARSVSVIVPAFNAERFLAQTLLSIRDQIASPGEVIVVDDGSTDATREIARALGATVIARSNGGPSAARNAGSAAARGEYLAFIDADDLWEPGKLAVQLGALQAYGRPAFSFTDYRYCDEHGRLGAASVLRRNPTFRRLAGRAIRRSYIVFGGDDDRPILRESYLPPSVLMVRRADYEKVGGFDEQMRAGEDYELLLRLLRIVPALAVMEPLTLYRHHPGQATAVNTTKMATAYFEVAARVADAPQRYRAGDAAYIARTAHLREYRLAMHLARYGDFAAAQASFARSLAQHPTPAAALGFVGARIAHSPAGRRAVEAARSVWKRRPGKS